MIQEINQRVTAIAEREKKRLSFRAAAESERRE